MRRRETYHLTAAICTVSASAAKVATTALDWPCAVLPVGITYRLPWIDEGGAVAMRGFRLLVTLVAAVATSALGQNLQSASSIPDFSGVWSHPFLTGFEPPQSGPGPVRNRSRRPDGVANFQQLVGDYTNPILKPQAADVVKKHGEITLSGNGYPTPSSQCWPGGVPYVFWDFLVQIFQEKNQITMIYRQGNEVRRVRMNATHPAHPVPSW